MANTFSNIQDWLSGGQLGAGLNASQTAANIVGGTQVPDLSTLIPQLQQQVASGQITPQQAQAAIQGASAYNNINVNPQTVQDQQAAINQMKQVATQGGMTAIDRAQLNDIQQQISNQNAAQQQAIQTKAEQQGLGSAGSALAAKMLASQGNATGAANAGATVAANAQARALQAMQNYGQGAANLNTQQFGQQQAAANAQNAINNFNAANQQAANIQGAALNQAAQGTNIASQNAINLGNTGIANQNLMMPLQTAQANFTNTMGRNTATANALNALATNQLTQGNKTLANTGAGIAAGATALAPYAGAIGSGIQKGYNYLTGAPAAADTTGSVISGTGLGGGALDSSGTVDTITGTGLGGGALDAGTGAAAADTGSWLGNAADTVSGWFSDERVKKDISPADAEIESMMEHLTGKKFKYKTGHMADDGQEHISPMAQDIEKAGLNVQDTPDGKFVQDDAKMRAATLAALGNLHQRIKKIEG